MKFFLHKTQVLKTQDLCGIFIFAKQVFWTRVSKTRNAIFHNSFKRCLTYYIEMLNVVSLLIPPCVISLLGFILVLFKFSYLI